MQNVGGVTLILIAPSVSARLCQHPLDPMSGVASGGLMIFETKKCCGCKSCEMACSYHHKGVFSPSIASIKVLDTKDRLGFVISLAEQNDGRVIACDRCEGLDEPLCVKYCTERDELQDILKEFSHNR